MGKTYSKKERQFQRNMRNAIIALLGVVLLTVLLSIVQKENTGGERQYTAEEMLHDHDGDGIPDH